MFKFRPDILQTERDESLKCLHRIGVGHAFNKLMNGPHGVWPNGGGCIFEDNVQRQIKQRFREVDANLATSASNGIHQFD